ncbi:MAG: BatD family protein [Endomicrobium sp.]|jgi:hypothetical protein|nr:BatD family protein [Endomicrobium sp.]
MLKPLLSIFLMLSCAYVYAGDITFTASVDKNKIALNEYLVYSLMVSGEDAKLPQPTFEELADFNSYGRGQSQTISSINGKRSGKITYTYTLAPKKIGNFTIPPAKIEYDKKTYFTESINIEVTEAAKIQSAQVQQTARQQASPSSRIAENIKGNVFVKASTNKKIVYVNEKVTYKFSFYTNMDLVSNPEYFPPDFKGFWNDSSKPSNRYENIDGVNYLVNEIETTIYPIESGKITISPAKLKIAVMDFSSPGNIDDFFSLFINMGQRREKMLESDAVTLNVLPLPKENVPLNFKGAVGNFTISIASDKTEVHTDEPVTLTVKVTGKGNMKSVSGIDFKPTKDFKVYDTVSSNVAEDSREFQILLLPLTPGEKTIEPLKLSFFDPAKKTYSSAQTQSLKIKVEGAAVVNPENIDASGSSGILKIQNDINYNKQIKKIKFSKRYYFVKTGLFWIILAPFVLFFAFALFFKFYIEKKNNNPLARLRMQAYEYSQKCILSAEGKISKEKSRDFYESIYEGLLSAITAATAIPSDKLSVSEISENLKNFGFDDDKIKAVEEILNLINFYRFASVQSDEKSMRKVLEQTKEILNVLRKQ